MIEKEEQIYHLHFPLLDSTQEYAKREYHNFSKPGLYAISAKKQTAGQGSRKKSWLSPEGSLSLSLYYQKQDLLFPSNLAQFFTFVVMETLRDLSIEPLFKWPNDLLLNSKKLGGVLTTVIDKSHFIFGIGLNINNTEKQLCSVDQPATSLLLETGKTLSIPSIRSAIAKKFLQLFPLFCKEGLFPFLEKINQYLAYKNQDVLIGNKKGKLLCFNGDGSITLHLENKEAVKINRGSIEPFFRPIP